jgi:4-amino-4-deoxy-L-arabinose transferase-like glycosyltransferase
LARRGLRLAGWAAVCWIVLFWRLGYLPLLDPDEAHYAQITNEMSAAHEWVVPLLEGKPYIDKPVLFHWLQGTAFWLLGHTEFAARIPSALAALALMALTAWFGRRLFSRRIGDRAALLFATLPATFALSSVAIFDMLFAVCLFGALACLVVGALDRRLRLQDLGFILTAAAVLTKGPVAVILLAIAAGLCFAHPTTRLLTRQLPWLRGMAIVIAIGAPWFLWMWYRFGQTFVDLYVLDNNLRLFGQPIFRQRRYPFFYGRVLLSAFLPWSLLLIGRAVDLLRRPARLREMAMAEVVLWAWFVTVVGFFSLSWFKLATYIFPAAPAMCLLAAHAWERARATDAGRTSLGANLGASPRASHGVNAGANADAGARASVVAIAGVVALIGLAAALFLFNVNLPVPRAALALPIALVFGGLAFALQVWRAGWRPPMWGTTLIVSLLFAYVTVVVLGFPILQRTRPTMDIARWVVGATPPGEPLALYRLDRWQASLRFYAGRPIVLVNDVDELRRFFAQHRAAPCVITQKDLDQLRETGGPGGVRNGAPSGGAGGGAGGGPGKGPGEGAVGGGGGDLDLRVLYTRQAVVGNEGRVFRKQRWGGVLVVVQSR